MKASQGVSLFLPSVMGAAGLLGLLGGSGYVWAKSQGAGEGANGADKPVWREIVTLKHEHAVHRLACSADLCAAVDEGGNVFAWSTKTGDDRTAFTKGLKEPLGVRLQFTADGKDLYTSFGGPQGIMRFPVKNNIARIWEASTGKELAALKAHTDSVRGVAFDPTGEILITGSADKTVKIWQAK